MNLVNLYNRKRKICLFLRNKEGKLSIKWDNSFYPYYYEEDPKGEFKSIDGKPLKKEVVSEPAEVKRLRSENAYEGDVRYCTRYLVDRVDKLEKTYIKYAMLDIEVLTPPDEFPDEKTAQFPISSITIYNSMYDKVRNWFLGDFGTNLKKAEIDLFKEFIIYLQKAKFDILFGWFFMGFDFPYMYNRFAQLPQKSFFDKSNKYNNFAVAISPIKSIRAPRRNTQEFLPGGTACVDYLSWFKKFYKNEKAYSLDCIMEKYLGEGKVFKEVDFSQISEEVRQRNIGDVVGMKDLEQKKFKLIPLFDEIRRFSKVGWEDMDRNSRVIDSLLLQEASKKKVILPMGGSDNEKEFEGAYRDALQTGVFHGVGKYDLSGAYMNVIVDLCLDPNNITESINEKVIPVSVTDRKSNQTVETYLLKQDTNALLPSVIKRLLQEKSHFKKELKEASIADEDYDNKKFKYEGIKNVVLSGWGVIGNKHFRYFDYRVAGMITSVVRDLVHYVEDKVKEKGYEVIYVDTDAVFIIDKGQDLLDYLNGLIQKWSKERFGKSSSIEFEFEGRFEDILILAKCRYKGFIHDGKELKPEVKGVEIKRSDSSTFLAKFQDTVINKIFAIKKGEESEKSIKIWIKEQIHKMRTGQIPLIEFAFPTHLNKKPEEYTKNVPVFLSAYNNTKEILPNFYKRVGELFYYIYVKPDKKDITITTQALVDKEKIHEREGNIPKKDMIEELLNDNYLTQDDLKTKKVSVLHKKSKLKDKLAFDENNQDHIKNIDFQKMIERNILNKVKVIFDAMKWDYKEVSDV